MLDNQLNEVEVTIYEGKRSPGNIKVKAIICAGPPEGLIVGGISTQARFREIMYLLNELDGDRTDENGYIIGESINWVYDNEAINGMDPKARREMINADMGTIRSAITRYHKDNPTVKITVARGSDNKGQDVVSIHKKSATPS